MISTVFAGLLPAMTLNVHGSAFWRRVTVHASKHRQNHSRQRLRLCLHLCPWRLAQSNGKPH